jgi:hypothetical protein
MLGDVWGDADFYVRFRTRGSGHGRGYGDYYNGYGYGYPVYWGGHPGYYGAGPWGYPGYRLPYGTPVTRPQLTQPRDK